MTISGEVPAVVECKRLGPGSRIDVETKSRHYLIECLGGNQIRVSGHPTLCPEPKPGWLQGSVDHEGAFDNGMITPGKRLVFFLNDSGPVTTSRVIRVNVEKAEPVLPPSGSVH